MTAGTSVLAPASTQAHLSRVGAAARRWGPSLGAFALVTTAAWLLFFQHAYLQYDTIYSLTWGQDLAGGRHPMLEAPNAPTPHPLGMLYGLIATLLVGDAADDLLLAGTVISFALLLCAVYLLGTRAFSRPVGVLGALLIATSYPLLQRAGSSFFDIPFVALVVLAAAMEVERPRRGLPVLALLTVAGLLRPEAWLVTGAYLLYLAPGVTRSTLVRAVLVAAIAPILWIGMDVALTGDPVHSFVHTKAQLSAEPETGAQPRDLTAADQGSHTTLTSRASYAVERFGGDTRKTIRLPVIAGALLGIFFALLAARRRVGIPLALLAIGTGTYLLLGLGGLYLMERFTFLAACMLAIFCAVAAVGWIGRDLHGRLRWGWIAAGALVLLVLAGTAPAHLDTLPGLRDAIASRSAMTDDLQRLTNDPAGAEAFRSCGSATVQNYRGRPHLAYLLDRDPSTINASPVPPPSGAYVVAATTEVRADYLRRASDERPFAKPPFKGFRQVAGNHSFLLYTKGCG